MNNSKRSRDLLQYSHRRTGEDAASRSLYNYINHFQPLPWQKQVLLDLSGTILLAGSAGGGKSRVAGEKVHAACLHYPGFQAIISRKFFSDMAASCINMMDIRVIGDDPRVVYTKSDRMFRYNNGSIIYLVGMGGRDPERSLRSIGVDGAVDMIWMEEGSQNTESDFEEFGGRLRGKSSGWSQLIVSTNPAYATHWINRRLIIGGEASVHLSSEDMNPHNPPEYIKRLAAMTGVKGKRMREGLWVSGTGKVLDTWVDDFDRTRLLAGKEEVGGNVTESADYIPGGGTIWCLADDGYAGKYDKKAKMYTADSHPRVFLLAQERGDGRLAVFAESYAIKTLYPEHIAELKKLCHSNGWPYPTHAVYDSASPSLGRALKNSGIRNVYPAKKANKKDTITDLREALAPDFQKWRRIIVHPRTRLLRLEMASWPMTRKNVPAKYFDNGPDALRYGNTYIFGNDRIQLDIETVNRKTKLDVINDRVDALYDHYMGDINL